MLITSMVVSAAAFADLQALDDSQMSAATGEGLGFALEDFVLDTEGAELSVTGIQSSAGEEIDIKWTSLYVMGEGSEEGSIRTPGQVGSYNHPYVIRTLRGSRGLSETDPDFNQNYSEISNDLGLLEIAADSYSSPLQDSNTFATFSYYQGCIWGEPGCNDLNSVGSNGIAVQAITEELNSLIATRDQIANTFTIALPTLEAEIDNYFNNVIAPQEAIVEQEQAQYDAAVTELGVRLNAAVDAYDALVAVRPQTNCEFGENCGLIDANCGVSGACFDARSAYNTAFGSYEDQQDVRQDEYNDLIEERKTFFQLKNEPGNFAAAAGSYNEAVESVEEFRVLCGSATTSFQSCSEGLIARKQETKDGVESVSVALFDGVERRDGLDIGASFEFTVNAVNTDGSSASRTDFIDLNMKGLFIDGTAFRLWSAPDEQGDDEINAEIRLNLFVKELDISVCDPSVCDGNPAAKEASTLNLDNLFVSLNLGYGEIQPMRLSATSDGNFQFELTKLRPGEGVDTSSQAEMQDFYNDYYENAPKSFISISDVRIGSGADASLGGVTVDGLRAQYLKVTSRDL
jgi:hypothetical protein